MQIKRTTNVVFCVVGFKTIRAVESSFVFNLVFQILKNLNLKKQTNKKVDLRTVRDVCVRVDVHRYVSGDVSETNYHGYENDIFS